MKKLKSIPQFKNEDEEREFWATHDSTDYVDWSKAEGEVTMRCHSCGRDVERITRHHLVPQSRHHNKKAKKIFVRNELNRTVILCNPCHHHIHTVFSEKELERQYHAIEDIKNHPDMVKFIAWLQTKPADFAIKVRR